MQFPIIIGLRRSRFLDGALGGLSIATLLAVYCVPWPALIAWPLAAVLLLLAFDAARRLAPPLAALRIDGDGKIAGRRSPQDAFVPLRLLPGGTLHPLLTVLRLAGETDQYRLLIAADSAAPEDFRRLRVCLRWRADFNGRAADS